MLHFNHRHRRGAAVDIDTQIEKTIQAATDRLLQGHTAFVITHRLSTIVAADQIVVLQHGQIMGQRTHEELLARRGLYHHLYTMGFTIVRLGEEGLTARFTCAAAS